MKSHLLLAALLALLASAAAQEHPALAHLRAGRMALALAELDRGRSSLNGSPALEAGKLLVAHATQPGARAELIEPALTAAMEILGEATLSAELQAGRHELLVEAGLALGRRLTALRPKPLTAPHAAAVTALERARISVLQRTPVAVDHQREILLLLIPLVADLKRTTQLIELCREALALPLPPSEAMGIQELLGQELLRIGKIQEAIPLLLERARREPTSPTAVGVVARALIPSDPARSVDLLLPVIRREPGQGAREEWQGCLEDFYRALEDLPRSKDPALSLISQNRIDLALPQIWGGTVWRPGFRVYREENTYPGKVYSGRHRLQAVVPFSAGWARAGNLPVELTRWNNVAFAIKRGDDGPLLVAYWFAPDLSYWYGTTPQERGVTGKKVLGYNKGGIASLVEDACYGRLAEERGLRFRRASQLPLPFGVPTGVLRRSWSQTSWRYEEWFFPIGQVTIEVLLRIRERDLELLKPELRWLMESVRYI